MPHKMWVHNCKESYDSRIGLGVELCPDCGERGKYDGWHYSVIEHMSAYSSRTGLAPIGAHRALADKLINPHMKACKKCKGRGVLDIENGKYCKTCPNCKGNQYIFDGSEEELAELRREVLQSPPDPESDGYTGGFFIRPKDSSAKSIKEASKAMARALGITGKRKVAKSKSSVRNLALSVRQPFAEQIMRGTKKIEYRSMSTQIRGRVYIYASKTPGPETAFKKMKTKPGDFPVGVLIGTAEILSCKGTDGDYRWGLANPQRLKKPIAPEKRPQPVWFKPFKDEL
jgi:hypothetical protein